MASLVLGAIGTDQSIDINASGIVLSGDIVSSGGGAITLGNNSASVEVARDVSIVSQNGVISIGGAVNSLVNAGLIVNSGYNGTVNLGGNIGSRSNSSLKWVEVDAAFVNATNITIRTMGAAAAQTTVGEVGSPRQGEVIWNVNLYTGAIGFDTIGGGIGKFAGAKSVRNPTGGLKLN